MERYIGDLKKRLTNMASIDMNLAHGALKMELLHHLPRPESSVADEDHWPKLRQRLPVVHVTTIKADGTKVVELPLGIKRILDARFGSHTHMWPMRIGLIQDDQYGPKYKGTERVVLHTKMELVWRLPIGSEYSQAEFAVRRNDSYISWRVAGKSTLSFGQVVIFCKCYDWDDIIVIVRAFKRVSTTPMFELSFVEEDLGGLESIKHTEIVNIIGRIEKKDGLRKVTYLVRNRAESALEVSSSTPHFSLS